MSDATKIPAAQYLRMSRENQKYSIPYQAAAIANYAGQNGFVVVRTYTDPGRSGLGIRNRPGLTGLLQDVVSGGTNYKAILVYDVSRWGRFQDTDEAAHYEFLCRRSGIPVHYCAEQFTNDLTATNMILKFLKRTMAAEYSRNLSVRVYGAIRRLVEEGFHSGSTPGYGFRRMLFSTDGKPKQILRDGEEKNLQSDRVRLVPGPPPELRVIRLIYRMLLHDRLRPAEIARELARRGVTFYGRPWSFYAVRNLFTHPKYCGIQVWGRTEAKFKTPPKRVPKERWIISANRGEQIVDEQTLARAQKLYYDRTDQKTNDELLNALRKLWRKKGRLSTDIIELSRLTPTVSTYCRRFGSLRKAYQLIGYEQQRSLVEKQIEQSRHMSALLRRELAQRLQLMFPGRVTAGDYEGCLRCSDAGIDVVLSLCRTSTIRGYPVWSTTWRREQSNAVTLLCLLNNANNGFRAFYVFPRQRMRRGRRIYRDSFELLSEGKKIRLREFYRAVCEAHRQLPPSEQVRHPDMLHGVPQIARFLGQTLGITWRLVRQGMPVVRQNHCIKGIPAEISQWVRTHEIVNMRYTRPRDCFGRFTRQRKTA